MAFFCGREKRLLEVINLLLAKKPMIKQMEFEKEYMNKKKHLLSMIFLSLEHIILNDLLKILRV